MIRAVWDWMRRERERERRGERATDEQAGGQKGQLPKVDYDAKSYATRVPMRRRNHVRIQGDPIGCRPGNGGKLSNNGVE